MFVILWKQQAAKKVFLELMYGKIRKNSDEIDGVSQCVCFTPTCVNSGNTSLCSRLMCILSYTHFHLRLSPNTYPFAFRVRARPRVCAIKVIIRFLFSPSFPPSSFTPSNVHSSISSTTNRIRCGIGRYVLFTKISDRFYLYARSLK